MSDIRFIRKDGQSVEGSIVRRRFFESAYRSGINPDRASAVWQAALRGDPYARDVLEELCDVEIVSSDAGFGFLK